MEIGIRNYLLAIFIFLFLGIILSRFFRHIGAYITEALKCIFNYIVHFVKR